MGVLFSCCYEKHRDSDSDVSRGILFSPTVGKMLNENKKRGGKKTKFSRINKRMDFSEEEEERGPSVYRTERGRGAFVSGIFDIDKERLDKELYKLGQSTGQKQGRAFAAKDYRKTKRRLEGATDSVKRGQEKIRRSRLKKEDFEGPKYRAVESSRIDKRTGEKVVKESYTKEKPTGWLKRFKKGKVQLITEHGVDDTYAEEFGKSVPLQMEGAEFVEEGAEVYGSSVKADKYFPYTSAGWVKEFGADVDVDVDEEDEYYI